MNSESTIGRKVGPAGRFAQAWMDSKLTPLVIAGSLARYVELGLEGADVIFSDNYFDLPAGRPVTITCAMPAGWDLAQARQGLRLRTLKDSY